MIMENAIFNSKFLDENLISNLIFEAKMSGIKIPKVKISQKSKPVATMATAALFLKEAESIVNAAPQGVKDIHNINVENMFDPLILMLQKFSFPIAVIIGIIGGIMIMTGNSEGKEKIKGAIIGLILVAFIPSVMWAIYKSFM